MVVFHTLQQSPLLYMSLLRYGHPNMTKTFQKQCRLMVYGLMAIKLQRFASLCLSLEHKRKIKYTTL